jgi:hypothetical protein
MGRGMGFKAAKLAITKDAGVNLKSAGAILASSTRQASPVAKLANPNLLRVKAPAKKK